MIPSKWCIDTIKPKAFYQLWFRSHIKISSHLTYTAEILLSCATLPMCASMHLSQSALGYVVCFSDLLNSRVSVLTAKKIYCGMIWNAYLHTSQRKIVDNETQRIPMFWWKLSKCLKQHPCQDILKYLRILLKIIKKSSQRLILIEKLPKLHERYFSWF